MLSMDESGLWTGGVCVLGRIRTLQSQVPFDDSSSSCTCPLPSRKSLQWLVLRATQGRESAGEEPETEGQG
jgi:hypothetical protein